MKISDNNRIWIINTLNVSNYRLKSIYGLLITLELNQGKMENSLISDFN